MPINSSNINGIRVDILKLVAAGKTDQAIGHELGYTARTVGAYISRMLVLLWAVDRASLVTRAYQERLFHPDDIKVVRG